MSNGDDRNFAFIERGTDPRSGIGLDAPLNALSTFEGELFVKTGEEAKDWKVYKSKEKPEPKDWLDFVIDDFRSDVTFFYESDGITSHVVTLPPFVLTPLGRRYTFVSGNNDTAASGAHFRLRAWNNDVRVNNVLDTTANPIPLVGPFAIHMAMRGVSRWTLVRWPRE